MVYVKLIINACISILNTHIVLFGYSISLSGVMLFCMFASLLLFFFHRVFR